MRRIGCILAAGLIGLILAGVLIASATLGDATIEEETAFVIPDGSSLTAVARKLEDEGFISSADAFLLRARLLGGDEPIQAGEFALTPDMDQGDILAAFQSGDVIRRFVTIPEGLPSVLVVERLMAEELLTGEIAVPPEGSILPDTYDFERGESRAAVIGRMQTAMAEFLKEAWPKRTSRSAVSNVRDAVILASVVEKETGVPDERRMVAGLYSNRLRQGILLQADPTIIYPITQGRPLGRRIRQSEINAVNGYNTYTRAGLPEGPIANPGRESIMAVLDPAQTDAIFMVADGSGGHAFATTLEEHNANVAKWRAFRQQNGI